ncbi:hypothetical protein P7C70_g4253, partial [Phenoliferia sp. Uapishka_3]
MTPRRSATSSRHSSAAPLTISPTFSTLSSLSSSYSSETEQLSPPFDPSSSDSSRKLFPEATAVAGSIRALSLHHSSNDDSSELSSAMGKGKGKGKPLPAPKKVKKERQTRIQEHLRSVKPGSPSPSASSSKSSSSSYKLGPSHMAKKAKRKAPTPVDDDADISDLAQDRCSSTSISVPCDLDVAAMAEEEVQARLKQEKEQLMARLASHGINPHPDVLDHVLHTMASGGGEDGVTVQSFLTALSSLDTASPRDTPDASVEVSPKHTHTTRSSPFGTLEASPVIATKASRVASTHPVLEQFGDAGPSTRSSRRAAHPSTPPPASPFLAQPGTFSSALGPSPEITASPAERRNSRLHAFGMRRSNSAMVAADIQGMGRVAMTRDTLVERLGSDTAEQAIAAAGDLLPAVAFGRAMPKAGPPGLDTFRAIPFTRKRQSSQTAAKGPVVDERLGLVKSWLESSPDVADEEAPEAWSKIPSEWDEDFETSTGRAQRVKRLKPSTNNVEPASEVEEIRVGGKSVRILLRSKRLRVEDVAEMDQDPQHSADIELEDITQPSTSQQFAPATTMRRQKSHLSKSLPASSTRATTDTSCTCGDQECDRCASVASSLAHSTPAAKRVTLAQPTTPVFYREPTFVSAPSSPRLKESFYQHNAGDIVLAPSPQSSPSRRFPPQSPIHSHVTPVTPQLGHVKADYAPRSPLFFRAGRSRMVSGAFDDLPAVQGGWVSSWDGHVFGVEEPLAPTDDSDFWHDMTLTPSRSLASSAYGWEQGLQQTPTTGGRRNRLAAGLVPSTPSQDFLSSLHNYPVPSPDTNTHAIAQRLFGSPSHHAAPPHHSIPSSPLSKGNRARIPSSGAFFQHQSPGTRLVGSSFPSVQGHSRRLSFSQPPSFGLLMSPKLEERRSSIQEEQTELPVAAQASSSMARSGSGLGMSFGHVQLDGEFSSFLPSFTN